MKVKLQSILTLYAFIPSSQKINIISLNNEDKCPRQQHHVTVISLLIKKAAFILAEQHGQIQCTMV